MLMEGLCRETEPSKLYKTLKKLSSLPMLGDTLEEIGFRQTMKLLKKQKLLVPYAKALAAPWLEKSQLEAQPMTELPRNCGEDLPHQPATPVLREEELGEKTGSSKSEAGTEKSLSPMHPKRPRYRAQARSFEECLNYDSPTSSALQPPLKLRLLPCKRKRKNTWVVESQGPKAKVPLGGSGSFQDWDGFAASPLPEVASSPQDCFQLLEPENSSMNRDQETPSWACRKNSKTPIYSGRPTVASCPLLQKSQRGRLAESHSVEERHCRPGKKESEPRQPEKASMFHTHHGKPTQGQPATQRNLQGQESDRQMALQALVARLQSTQAKKPQGRQAKTIAVLARPKIPEQQTASRPRGAASSLEKHSLPEASAQSQQKGAPCPSLGSSTKTKAKKKPAPLMAKALKAYNHRFSGR